MEAAQRVAGTSDSVDVTLASSDTKCKFHSRGHCKFGAHCKNIHIKETCAKIQCVNSSCEARHPRPCMYFMRLGQCKFGSACSYLHCEPIPSSESNNVESLKSDIVKLEEALERVLAALDAKETEMEAHEQRIIYLENLSKRHKCTHCEYEASSTTSLKSHISKKHKVPSPEVLLSSSPKEESRRLSPEKDTPRAPDPSTFSIESDPTPFKCEQCQYETTHRIKLSRHKAVTHNPGVPHTSFWDNNKCHICTESFPDTFDFKNHMIDHHSYTFNCDGCDCGETSPIGLFYANQGCPGDSPMVCMQCSICLSDDPGW
jgi:hypothetical protein